MAARTKILFLITQSVLGGAQRHVLDLARSLPKDAYDVAVAAGGSGILHEKLRAAGVRTLELPFLTRLIRMTGDFSALFALTQLIRTEQPDILHLHSSKAGALGAVAGRMAGVQKIVFTLHGWALNENRSPLSKIFLALAYGALFLCAHKIIAVSEGMARYVRQFPLAAHKVTVIHDTIDAITFVPQDEARAFFLSKAGWTEKDTPMLVGTFAELHHIKGLRYAIDAIALLKERGIHAKLLIAGEGIERKNLEMHIREKHVKDRVALVGFVDDVRRYAKGIDVFILPSLSEALSYSLLEAGLAGVAAIGTKVGGIPEVITDGETGLLVPARDALALTDALGKVLKDPTLRGKLGASLHERVQKDFSLQQMLSRTIAVYRET